uniref:Uncharacterized protein n=1 Tax=Oryza brachyantha TaxID=4533 RepID=J3N5L3_ORYBR
MKVGKQKHIQQGGLYLLFPGCYKIVLSGAMKLLLFIIPSLFVCLFFFNDLYRMVPHTA